MDQMQALEGAMSLIKADQVSTVLTLTWWRTNDSAKYSYKNLYDQVKKALRHEKSIPIPETSQHLLEECRQDILVENLRENLRQNLSALIGRNQRLSETVDEYLVHMNQLVALAYFIVMQQSQRVGSTITNEKSQPTGASQPKNPVYSKPGYFQPQPITAFQEQLDSPTKLAAELLDKALIDLTQAQKQMDDMRQQISDFMPQLVMRSDWNDLAKKLSQSNIELRDTNFSITSQLVAAITDLEHQYGLGRSNGTDEPTAERVKFERSLHTIVASFEAILMTNFGIKRIPIRLFEEPDRAYMDWDIKESIVSGKPEHHGTIAQVESPGYLIVRSDSDPQVFRKAKVILFK